MLSGRNCYKTSHDIQEECHQDCVQVFFKGCICLDSLTHDFNLVFRGFQRGVSVWHCIPQLKYREVRLHSGWGSPPCLCMIIVCGGDVFKHDYWEGANGDGNDNADVWVCH